MHSLAGPVHGRTGPASSAKPPHMRFEIRPAGRGAPRVDPKPILDGWKLLESTAIYRAQGENPFVGRGAPAVGPKPIPRGLKVLQAARIFPPQGENPFVGTGAAAPTVGQILLMS